MSAPTRVLAAALCSAALSGCVSLQRSPEARYFVLRSLAEGPASPAAPAAAVADEWLLGVLPARVPAALARPQLVTATAPGELRVDPLHRWAEPLDEGVTRTLAENLGALLPGCRVLRSPWAAAAPLRARLAVELQAFGPQPDGAVRIVGSFALLDPREERALVRRSFSLSREVPAAGAGAGDLAAVEAMSALLAELAGQVASQTPQLR